MRIYYHGCYKMYDIIDHMDGKLKAKITRKQEVAKGTLETTYDLLGQKVDFQPGQYIHISLPGKDDKGALLIHHFTIVSSPHEHEAIKITTRMRETAYKNALSQAPVGTEVALFGLKGNFLLPGNTSKPLVFLALGIGITPYVSMLRFIKQEKLDYQITLIYSDSDRASMAYLDELEAYQKDNPKFKLISTITRDPLWTGEKRHVDEQFIKDYISNPNGYIYYVSGPPKAVEAIGGVLQSIGIEKENIKQEDFTGY